MYWLLWLTLLALHLSPAVAYSEQYCANLTQARTAAFLNRDWHGVLETSSDFEKECAGVGNRAYAADYVANAIGSQSDALIHLSRYAEALSAAERCLALQPLPDCYLAKGRALLLLARVEEGRLQLQEAKRSAAEQIALADASVRTAAREVDRCPVARRGRAPQ